MVIFSGAWAILQLSAVIMRFAGLGGLAFISLAEDIYFALKYPVMIAAILFLSSGLREVALSVGLDKLSRKTAIFTAVSALGYIGTSVQSLLPTGEIWAYFAALTISLLFFVQYFMMLALIFSSAPRSRRSPVTVSSMVRAVASDSSNTFAAPACSSTRAFLS